MDFSMSLQNKKRLLWLEILIDQSLTFSSWKKIETKLNPLLKENVESKLMDPVRTQLLFEILGSNYVTVHFPSHPNNTHLLDDIPNKERETKTSEMRTLINSVFENAIYKKNAKGDENKIQSDFAAFSKDLKGLIDHKQQQQSGAKPKKNQVAAYQNEKFLLEMFSYDPTIVDTLIPKLQINVAVLSDSLRTIIWPSCITNKDKGKRKNEGKIEEFARLYKEQDNRILSASTKDIDKISSAVRKIYKESASLKFLDSVENRRCSTDILYICHMCGKRFEPHFPNYAAVMQEVYLKDKVFGDENFEAAAVMLDKMLRLCNPPNNQALKISNKILHVLQDMDDELTRHINQKFLDSAVTNDQGNSLREADFSFATNDSIYLSSNRTPATFIQKWIIDAFVSILNFKCLLFVWDQLYLNKWENKVLEEICLALIGLLKPWFMLAKNQEEIEKVFLNEPSLLYLLDIRKAFHHIRRKGNFLDIPQMNRNIQLQSEPQHVEPDPIPPPSTPSPKQMLPKPTFFQPWVPYNKEKFRQSATSKTTVEVPFDFYIDSVRFVPDNSTIVKITGKILNMYFGQKEKFIKFQSFPEFDSFWRYPKFKMKQTVNRESIPMNPDVVIMIRIYTIEKHSKEVTVLGSCLFGPFSNKFNEKQVSLRVGGHQIRVRHGIPNPEFDIENMLASHMDENPAVPGITVLLRVLPHQKEYVEAPDYETNYFRSSGAEPNASEIKLYKHYQESKDFSQNVREVALLLCEQVSVNDEALLKFMQQLLNKEGSTVKDFPYQRFVNYKQEEGVMILADKASALPLFLEGRYLQCLVQVLPGEESRIGNSKNQAFSFITEELDLDSPQRSPDWVDFPTKVNLEYDEKCVIFVSLYGLRPRFGPSADKVLDKEGKEPNFNLQHAIAWSATNCFQKGAVFAGTHHVPLLKGRPSEDIIEKLSYLPLDYICKKFKSQVKVFDAASIEIAVWDGRFSYNECPPLPAHTNFLNISLNPEKYIKASEQISGVTVETLLKQGLQDQSEFENYKDQIVKLLKSVFRENIDRSLRKAGYNQLL